jgi:NADH:ubiquinone oxidoreductase subunit F (NADH-binding)
VNDSILDIPMSYQDLKKAGASLGSGAIIILDESRSLYDLILSILEFFRHESCGKCIPCRVGTSRLVTLWEEAGAIPAGARGEALEDLTGEAEYMAASSLCPLGKSPIISLKSALQFFRDRI